MALDIALFAIRVTQLARVCMFRASAVGQAGVRQLLCLKYNNFPMPRNLMQIGDFRVAVCRISSPQARIRHGGIVMKLVGTGFGEGPRTLKAEGVSL